MDVAGKLAVQMMSSFSMRRCFFTPKTSSKPRTAAMKNLYACEMYNLNAHSLFEQLCLTPGPSCSTTQLPTLLTNLRILSSLRRTLTQLLAPSSNATIKQPLIDATLNENERYAQLRDLAISRFVYRVDTRQSKAIAEHVRRAKRPDTGSAHLPSKNT